MCDLLAMKPTVGLTGGIACGKSTVAGMFGELGVPVVDADQLARDVVAPGTDGLTAVVEAFGPEFLLADGSLDREKLGALVFADDEARRRLNGILHPRIQQASMAALASLQEHSSPYLLYDAALLVENGLHRMFPALVVVRADRATQLARLRERDGLSRQQAEARIEAQLPVDAKVAVADYVIDNDGSLEATRAQVEEVHRKLLERFGGRQ